MIVARAIEPGLFAEVDAVDDESVAVPAPARVAHPPVDVPLGMRVAVHVDLANRVVVLVEDVDLVRLLHDLERERHEGDARHAGEETSRFRIERRALLRVLPLLRERFRFVRNLVAGHHAAAGGHAKARAVIQKIPRGGIEHLPDALNIRLTVGQLRRRVRRRVRRRLRARRGREDVYDHEEREGREGTQPMSHGPHSLK